MAAYLVCLRSAARSAAAPGVMDVRALWEAANVSGQVTSTLGTFQLSREPVSYRPAAFHRIWKDQLVPWMKGLRIGHRLGTTCHSTYYYYYYYINYIYFLLTASIEVRIQIGRIQTRGVGVIDLVDRMLTNRTLHPFRYDSPDNALRYIWTFLCGIMSRWILSSQDISMHCRYNINGPFIDTFGLYWLWYGYTCLQTFVGSKMDSAEHYHVSAGISKIHECRKSGDQDVWRSHRCR